MMWRRFLDEFDASLRVTRAEYLFAEVKPEAKQSVRFGQTGPFTDPKKRRYVKMIADLLCDSFGSKEPMYGDLRVTVIYSFPWLESDRRLQREVLWCLMNVRPDVDNLYKPVADALARFAFGDDARVAELRARKIRADVPGIAVKIEAVEPIWARRDAVTP